MLASRLLLTPTRLLPALLFGLLLALAAPASGEPIVPEIQAHPELKDGIHVQSWIHYPETFDLMTAASAAKAKDRTLMILFEQEGCSYCRQMHTVNFTNAPMVTYMVNNFDVYQLDMRGDKMMVDGDGKSVAESDFASANVVTGTPTTLFYDDAGREIFRLPGYLQTIFQFAALKYIVEDKPNGELSLNGFKTWIDANSERLTRELGGG